MTATVELLFTGKDDTGSAFGGILGNLGNMGNIVTGIKSAFDLAGQAIDAAVGLFTPFVDSASESEQAIVGLNTVLKSTGDTIGLTSQQLQDMATQLQGVTRYSDEQVTAAEAMLLRFENLNPIFSEALQLTTDYAASLKVDLTTAAQTVGKALDDPASGIGRLNTQFKLFNDTEMETIKTMAENGDVAGAQAIIMDRLREKVGGAAEAYGQTFAGQMDIAKNSMDNLREVIGGAFLPVLTQLTSGFSAFVNDPAVQSFVNDFAKKLSDLFSGIASGDITLVDLSQKFSDWTASIDWKKLSDDLAAGIDSVDWAKVGNQLYTILANIFNGIGTVMERIDWNALLLSFGRALANLFAGLAGYANWDTLALQWSTVARYELQQVGQAIVDGITTGVQWAWGNFKTIFTFGWDDVFRYIKQLLGIASPSTVFRDIGINIVQGLIDGWNSLFSNFKNLIGSGINDILKLFAPFLALFGISVPTGGSTLGGTAGGSVGGSAGGALSSGTVNNYFYGPVYFGSAGAPGAYYDCPSPHPLVAASGNQLVTTGF